MRFFACIFIIINHDLGIFSFEALSAERKSFKEKYLMIFKMIEYLSSSSKDEELDGFLTQVSTYMSSGLCQLNILDGEVDLRRSQ